MNENTQYQINHLPISQGAVILRGRMPIKALHKSVFKIRIA